MSKYKSVDMFNNTCLNSLFNNYHLTELGLYTDGKKKGVAHKSFPVYLMLSNTLAEYGIIVYGRTALMDLDKTPSETLVYNLVIPADLPTENARIIEQMYGYEDALVNVSIRSKTDMQSVFGFLYNTNDKSCILNHHVYGESTEVKKFSSIAELLKAINVPDFEEFLQPSIPPQL